MLKSSTVIAALIGSSLLVGTADADRGRRDSRSSCDRSPSREVHRGGHRGGHDRHVHRGRSKSYSGFSITIGGGNSLFHGSRWGGHRGGRGPTGWHGRGYRDHGWRGHGGFGHHYDRLLRHRVSPRTVVIERPSRRCAPVVVGRPVVVERPVIVERPVVQQRVIREVPVYREIERDPHAEFRPGWDALREGDHTFARSFFEREMTNRPNDPTPRVGLAIANAAGGLDDQADWAMRRASRVGLNRVHGQLPLAELDLLLRALEDKYAERSYEYNDRWFMVAALRYLQRDEPGAGRAADKALAADPQDGDAQRLSQISRYGA